MPFVLGMKRHPKAGRKKGSLNKLPKEVTVFCREVVESPEFQQKWRNYFKHTPLNQMDSKILMIAFAYAYGKPRERIEHTGLDSGPLRFTLSLGAPLLVNGHSEHSNGSS